MLGRSGAAWQRFDAARWSALGLAFASWGVTTVFYALPESVQIHPDVHVWRMLMRVVYMLCAWGAIVAVCGFAHRHLNRDNASRAYLTEAVFPVYILHQTLIVSIAHLIKPARMAPAPEGLILIVLTLTISFGVFELVRRVTLLRPLFGLGQRRDGQAAAPAAGGLDGQELPTQRAWLAQ
jgi:surface polysaccharide O-acyltransferase-like enzyme